MKKGVRHFNKNTWGETCLSSNMEWNWSNKSLLYLISQISAQLFGRVRCVYTLHITETEKWWKQWLKQQTWALIYDGVACHLISQQCRGVISCSNFIKSSADGLPSFITRGFTSFYLAAMWFYSLPSLSLPPEMVRSDCVQLLTLDECVNSLASRSGNDDCLCHH